MELIVLNIGFDFCGFALDAPANEVQVNPPGFEQHLSQ
jgi:hypothetical protein